MVVKLSRSSMQGYGAFSRDWRMPQCWYQELDLLWALCVAEHSCGAVGIDAHGQLFVWGENAKHQLSESDKDGNRTQPESVVMIPQTARNMVSNRVGPPVLAI